MEYVLFNREDRVCIFKLPPTSTSKGYYLDDWKDMVFNGIKNLLGGVKVFQKNNQLYIQFIQKDNSIFAQSPFPQNPLQAYIKTLDSQRGYAFRMKNPKKGYLWIGLVFRDKNDSFDFNAKINDYCEKKNLLKNPSKLEHQFKMMDFSLKQGEKIHIEGYSKNKKIIKDKNPFLQTEGIFEVPKNIQNPDFYQFWKGQSNQNKFEEWNVPKKQKESLYQQYWKQDKTKNQQQRKNLDLL